MADKNTADIGFEKQIWDAACVLRGNMDASEISFKEACNTVTRIMDIIGHKYNGNFMIN